MKRICRNPFLIEVSFLLKTIEDGEFPESRNPFLIEVSFLLRRCALRLALMKASQSLLNRGLFPTAALLERAGYKVSRNPFLIEVSFLLP